MRAYVLIDACESRSEADVPRNYEVWASGNTNYKCRASNILDPIAFVVLQHSMCASLRFIPCHSDKGSRDCGSVCVEVIT